MLLRGAHDAVLSVVALEEPGLPFFLSTGVKNPIGHLVMSGGALSVKFFISHQRPTHPYQKPKP